ncbi:MAG: 16S rRNA (uracil(1498)-N(3))-methyltransferase [Opitutales bacterium]|nr:16S rRNA (uracil(1498)-N(3))-methyltransferase [Opitutales bacterium]
MLRAFYDNPVPEDSQTLTLDPGESHHLVKVLRAGENEPVCVFDGKGHFWHCRRLDNNPKALTLAIERRETVPAPRCAIALAQAMPKGSLMDDIVRQATEIGAAWIFPLSSDRCEVRLDPERSAKKLERWKQIAVEACKQCGNAFLPQILPVTSLRDFLKRRSRPENEVRLTASLEDGTLPCPQIAARYADAVPETVLFFVGPEGDFSEEEYALLRQSGCVPVRLGRNVLRAATAAIYTLAVADQMRIFWGRQ